MTPSSSLHSLQKMLASAILSSDDSAAIRLFATLTTSKGLGVYRNNVLGSLTSVLRQTYPCVCKVVDERFFNYMADAFVKRRPPTNAVLSRYGGGLAEFIELFEPCANLPYLPDLARLEWMLHRAMRAPAIEPLSISDWNRVGEEPWSSLHVRLDPSMSLLESRWAVDRIWLANQAGTRDGEVSQIDEPCYLEVRRIEQEVGFRRLSFGQGRFLSALSRNDSVEHSAELAVEADPNLDLLMAIKSLFFDDLVCEICNAGSGRYT